MIRRKLKNLAKRIAGQQPRVPGAAATGRTPPTSKEDWQATAPTQPTPGPEPEIELEEPNLEVDAPTLKDWVAEGATPIFLDIREPGELPSGIIQNAYLLPMNQVPDRLDELPRDQKLIVYCAAGVRSYGVTHWLREQGFEDTWSLIGGAGAWFSAGHPPHQPDRQAPLGLLRPVKVPNATLEAHDIPSADPALSGAIHAVHRVAPEDEGTEEPSFQYDVRVFLKDGGSAMISRLDDTQFEVIGHVSPR